MVTSSKSAVGSGLNSLSKALKEQESAFQKASSGRNINRASDAPASLAVLAQLEASVVSLGQASRNIGDTSSALNIADAATEQISNLAVRQQELATQAANGTLSDAQRQTLQAEYSQLSQEIQRISESTEFNGVKLLEGETITTQAGTDSSANSQLQSGGIDTAALAAAAISADISTAAGARAAVDVLTEFTSTLARERGSSIGAAQARLDTAASAVESRKLAETSAASRIGDADMAEASSAIIRSQILSQTSTALVAQAGRLDRERVQALLG